MRFYLGLIASVLCLIAPVVDAEQYLHPVKLVSVEKQASYQALRRFSGRAVAARNSGLAFELVGRVDEVLVEAGQSIQRGDVLVKLDTSLLDAEIARINGALEENQAGLRKVSRDLSRQSDLQRKGYSSRQQMDDLMARRDQLLAQRDQLYSQQKTAKLRLGKSVLRAPFDGEVARKFVDTGAIVKPGEPVVELVQLNEMEAVVGIPEILRDSVHIGDEVVVRGVFGEAKAIVLSVSESVNPGTLTNSVRVSFPATAQVAPGSIVYLYLSQERAVEGEWLPLSALLEGYRGVWAVFKVVDKDGVAVLEKRSVSPIYQAGERVYVTSELQSGDQVVAAGVHRYVAGQKVSIR